MQGQATAEERLLKAGGSPLSSMSSENRRRVTTDSPALLVFLKMISHGSEDDELINLAL